MRPTSVNVIAWTYMILGSLSALSGFLVVFMNLNSLDSDATLVGPILQIIFASFLAYCGFSFLKGSELMRKILEISSYLLCFLIVSFGVKASIDFEAWYPFLGMVFYIIPFGFIIWALRGTKVRAYTEKST